MFLVVQSVSLFTNIHICAWSVAILALGPVSASLRAGNRDPPTRTRSLPPNMCVCKALDPQFMKLGVHGNSTNRTSVVDRFRFNTSKSNMTEDKRAFRKLRRKIKESKLACSINMISRSTPLGWPLGGRFREPLARNRAPLLWFLVAGFACLWPVTATVTFVLWPVP